MGPNIAQFSNIYKVRYYQTMDDAAAPEKTGVIPQSVKLCGGAPRLYRRGFLRRRVYSR
jgi:hypothetical protein